MIAPLVLRISVVDPLPEELIAAGIADADARLRDQVVAPERVRHVVPIAGEREAAEAARWLVSSADRWSQAAGRLRRAIVPAAGVGA